MANKLKPCPFCKSESVEFIPRLDGQGYFFCRNCKAYVTFADSKLINKLIEKWNRREE